MRTSHKRLKDILRQIQEVRVGLYGDFCLDAYWVLDPRGSEVSLETGLKANAIGEQYYSLGGASNVAANLAALNPKVIKVFGIYGNDVFGKEMIYQLNSINVNTDAMVVQKEKFDTYAFAKLLLNGKEQPRIDFGTYNKRSHDSDKTVLDKIRRSIKELDVFVINQQVPGSITNIDFINELNSIIAENSDKIFIVDSRHFTEKFKNVCFKVNNIEAANLSFQNNIKESSLSENKLKEIGKEITIKNGRPVFITLGEEGILAVNDNDVFKTPGINLKCELDIVGAGDTVLSAISCSLGSGSSILETIELANLAAAVTIQKLRQTGTASPEEILKVYNNIG